MLAITSSDDKGLSSEPANREQAPSHIFFAQATLSVPTPGIAPAHEFILMTHTPKPPRKKPTRPQSAKPAEPREKASLHPRNRHQGHYDFPKLIKASPELGKFVILNPYGKESIDFANPAAVRVFNRALLKSFYGIAHWDIPAHYLCPPIPGRADYLHFLADLLASGNEGEIPRGAAVTALDIGTGANCVYPLIGHSEYGWRFLGTDIDSIAVAAATAIIKSNNLGKAITLRQQSNRKLILLDVLNADERFDLSLCNPPFHASADEALRGSQRKWRALGKADPKRKLPVLNFGGQASELWCEGGESRFVTQLINESAQVQQQVLWFSTLVSKASNLPLIQSTLKKAGVFESRIIEMGQGQKQSRFVAWTFHDAAQQAAWRAERWM